MNKFILFVEDEKTQRDMFASAVDDWNVKNADAGRNFTYHIAETVEAAQEALDRLRCDAALFDLRVKSAAGGKAEPKGNAALEQREASIATPFLPNIVQRFGAYISRTGQPNIDIGRLS